MEDFSLNIPEYSQGRTRSGTTARPTTRDLGGVTKTMKLRAGTLFPVELPLGEDVSCGTADSGPRRSEDEAQSVCVCV